jgi:hypothetical protein
VPPKAPHVSAPAAAPRAEVNVELVPVTPAPSATEPPPAPAPSALTIGRRDLVFLLIGIAGALLAVLSGFLVRGCLRRGKPAEGDNPP